MERTADETAWGGEEEEQGVLDTRAEGGEQGDGRRCSETQRPSDTGEAGIAGKHPALLLFVPRILLVFTPSS